MSGKPSEQAIRAALEVLAEGLMRSHPEWEVRIHELGESLPPSSVVLSAAREEDVEAILGRPARDRR